jgi:integrase
VLTIPIGRMKRTRRDKEAFSKEVHVVPLSRQAIEVLQELHPLTGSGKLVFSGMRGVDRAISDATLTNGLRRMGYDSETMHVHGFRAMARTMVKERLKIDADIIERQLSHAIDNPLGKAYDRTTMMPERVLMMQGWADYLDKLKAGAEIIPIRAAV